MEDHTHNIYTEGTYTYKDTHTKRHTHNIHTEERYIWRRYIHGGDISKEVIYTQKDVRTKEIYKPRNIYMEENIPEGEIHKERKNILIMKCTHNSRFNITALE